MQTIYIGANRKKYNLKRNRVYTNRPESLIQPLKEKFNLIDKLFVPVDDLNIALDEMQTKGTPRYLALRQIETSV